MASASASGSHPAPFSYKEQIALIEGLGGHPAVVDGQRGVDCTVGRHDIRPGVTPKALKQLPELRDVVQ
jgi:hypothetical protein